MSTLRIATRKSPLALWQAEQVAQQLREQDPQLNIELIPIQSRGDQIQDRPLASLGGKALFVKTLEEALLRGQADLAVHSLKDVPADLEADFTLAAILKREDASDCLVSANYHSLKDLPIGAKVGTSSPRRRSLLLKFRPDLNVSLLRGNVDSRLKKCLAGEYDAAIFATAGLKRLGLAEYIREYLDQAPYHFLPAAGQGALAVECLAGQSALIARLQQIEDPLSAACAHAERSLVLALQGNCHSAIGAFASHEEGFIQLKASVLDPSGTAQIWAEGRQPIEASKALGEAVAQLLLDQGAASLL